MRFLSSLPAVLLITAFTIGIDGRLPGDPDVQTFDERPGPPIGSLPASIYDLLPLVPETHQSAAFLQAWHHLGFKAKAAVRDTVHVIQKINRVLTLLSQRRTAIYDTVPWFLRTVLENAA